MSVGAFSWWALLCGRGVRLRPAWRAATRIAVCRPGCYVMVLHVARRLRPGTQKVAVSSSGSCSCIWASLCWLGAWFETIRATRAGSRTELRQLLLVLLAWAAPILLAPPLFSRDVYSYAAQGQMVSKGLDPYLHGPERARSRHAPYPCGTRCGGTRRLRTAQRGNACRVGGGTVRVPCPVDG